MESQLLDDIACNGCGCVCDDLTITIVGGKVTNVENACELAKPLFSEAANTSMPVATFEGNELQLRAAIDRAASLMKDAKAPLVFGLANNSTETARAAIQLAETIGGTFDTTSSPAGAASAMAIQEVGQSTCTLGEIRHRADLVIFWGADPMKTHPRHFERYSVDPVGEFVPGGRADRRVVVINNQPNDTSPHADQFIQLKSGNEFDAVCALRCLVADVKIDDSVEVGGDLDTLRALAEEMKSCQCGALFFACEPAAHSMAHRQVEAWLRLVTELNKHTRFHARAMSLSSESTSASNVLSWQAGFPCAVNFNRGYPRFSPGEFSANRLLERKEVDFCLVIGHQPLMSLSPVAVAHLQNIPVVFLDHGDTKLPWQPAVRFTTSIPGIHHAGSTYRMDEVPIPLRGLVTSAYPSAAEVLNAIGSHISG